MRSILLRRVGAYGLDIALLFIVLAPLGYLVQRILGVRPVTARGIYATLVLNFSVPAWVYFALADHAQGGATVGKLWFRLRVETRSGGRVGAGQAFGRTAVKMVPWELAHVSLFLLAPAPGAIGVQNGIGLGASYVLTFIYILVAWQTRGQRSVHDLAASTQVTSTHALLHHVA